MNNLELSRIVHTEIKIALDEVSYLLKQHLEDINATGQDSLKAIDYFNRLRKEFNKQMYMREYRGELLVNLKKEYENCINNK